MAPGGLAVEQSVSLDGCFLGLALALDRDAAHQAPLGWAAVGSFAARGLVEDVREDRLEMVVRLEFVLDLPENFLRQRTHHREDGDGYLGIAEQFLDHAADGDDRSLAVAARPQVDIPVGVALDLAAAVIEPGVIEIFALQQA